MKKLAIVGSGPLTRDNAPFDDPTFDIWVFNEAVNSPWCKRWDACFQIHPEPIYTGHNTKDPHHWEWLQRKHFKPIYMQELDPRVPDSVRYPLEEARALAGVDMFPTSFAYMAALAILLEYKEVRIFGVELSASEYQNQANGYLFWFGFLRGRLGKENVDSAVLYLNKNIFNVPFYGYEGNFAFGADFFTARAKELSNQWEATEQNAQKLRQSIETAIFLGHSNRVSELSRQFQATMLESGELAGAQAEAERYAAFGERYCDRGGFEFAAATAQNNGEAQRSLVWHYGGMAEYVWNIWKQNRDPRAAQQMLGLILKMGAQAYEVGAQLGMYKENIGYLLKYDAVANAGGKVLLEAQVTA